MRIVSAWQQQLPDKDGLKSTVYDIAYSPDGAYLAAACGSRVFCFQRWHWRAAARAERAQGPGALRVVEQRRRLFCIGWRG